MLQKTHRTTERVLLVVLLEEVQCLPSGNERLALCVVNHHVAMCGHHERVVVEALRAKAPPALDLAGRVAAATPLEQLREVELREDLELLLVECTRVDDALREVEDVDRLKRWFRKEVCSGCHAGRIACLLFGFLSHAIRTSLAYHTSFDALHAALLRIADLIMYVPPCGHPRPMYGFIACHADLTRIIFGDHRHAYHGYLVKCSSGLTIWHAGVMRTHACMYACHGD